MRYFFSLLALLGCFTAGMAQTSLPDATNAAIPKAATTADLATYKGSAEVMVVEDELRGGIFRHTTDKRKPDNGIVFAASDKGGSWVRIYDKNAAVDPVWFGAGIDSTVNDDEAVKRALLYSTIVVSRAIRLSGKTTIPTGKTIEFAPGGSLYVTDTFPLKINAYIKANDYHHIFKGYPKVILATTSAPYVSACWFGAKSDYASGKGTDNTEPINNAIFGAQNVSDLYLPPAPANTAYRITSTINITKRTHFFSFRFHGGGTTLTGSGQDKASTLFADFKEGAAINIQGSRRTYISDLKLNGVNKAPSRIGAYDRITVSDAVNWPDSFATEGIKPTYAAITTDGEQGNKVWSADIVFERLLINNFYLGIGISQTGDVQGDRMRIQMCQINLCVYGISLGNAQNRACHFTDLDMTRVWCGITNTRYGNHTGSMFQMTGGQWCHVYKMFLIQPSYTGQCVISGLYTEAAGSIGEIGRGNPNNSSVLFTGCNLSTRDEGLHSNNMFTPPFYTLWAYGNVTFEGCNFWGGRHYMAMFAGSALGGFNGSAIKLSGCSFVNCNSIHIKGNSIIENTYLIPHSEDVNYNRNIMADLESNRRYNTSYNATTVMSGMESLMAMDNKTTGSANIKRTIPRFYITQNASNGISGISLSRDTMQFTFSTALYDSFFKYVLPNDILGTTLADAPATLYDNPTLQILEIDSKTRTVTAIARCKKITFDKIALYTNSFFTTKSITGIVQNGSDIVTQVANIDKLEVGDFITYNNAPTYRVLRINTDDKSIQLNRMVANTVNGRKELYNQLLDNGNASHEDMPNNNLKTVASSTAIGTDDHTIMATGATGDITLSLPSEGIAGHIYYIKKGGDTHTVTVHASKGTIDGNPTYVMRNAWEALQLQYDGSNYIILSK